MCTRAVNLVKMITAILRQVKAGTYCTPGELAKQNGWNTVLVVDALTSLRQGENPAFYVSDDGRYFRRYSRETVH